MFFILYFIYIKFTDVDSHYPYFALLSCALHVAHQFSETRVLLGIRLADNISVVL